MNKVRIVMLILQFLCNNSTAISPVPVSQRRIEPVSRSFKLDVLTVYNPEAGQCDSSPWITASNKEINPLKLKDGSIRWMALSRDMLKQWGGHIQYGDTISLTSGDATIDGTWVVQDTMNRRFTKRGDLLFDAKVRSTGRWSNVLITLQTKVNRKPIDVDYFLTGRP